MISCILVDDEPPALEVLRSYISSLEDLEIMAICKNAPEAIKFLQQNRVDLMFLDVKMPSVSGTDLLRSLEHPPKVIFVTAYRDYAPESYEFDAVDYLLKPVNEERFRKAISKYKKIMGLGSSSGATEYRSNPDAFVYVRTNKIMEKLLVNEVLYIESWKDYVKIFLSNGRELLVRQSISSMEHMLSEFHFLRVHRSFMVSLDHLTGYTANDLQIRDKLIPVGRLYKQQVKEMIKGF